MGSTHSRLTCSRHRPADGGDHSPYDIAVIGGGLVGSAIAYGLHGLVDRIAVLDEGDTAYRASRGNAGLVWVQGKGLGLGAYANWTRLSARIWPEFAAELRESSGIDVCYRQSGGLHAAFSEEEVEARRSDLTRLATQPGVGPYEWRMLDRQEVAALVPQVGRELCGASWSPLDGTVNPLKLLRSLHTALVSRGVCLRPRHRVQAIMNRDGLFRLATEAGLICARKIVLAAGLGSAELGRQIGIDVPVRPRRGQVVVLERTNPMAALPFTTLRQTEEGTWIIGDSHEDAGFADQTTSLAVLATLAERAVKLVPCLASVRVIRAWSALRVMTPDGFPVYQESASCPGAFVATCHSGVTLAAAHARLLPRVITGLGMPFDIAPFASRRFDVQAPA